MIDHIIDRTNLPDPQVLAETHALCFTMPRPWSGDEFATLLAQPTSVFAGDAQCFGLLQGQGDEYELLTLATHPDQRRQGAAWRVLAELASRTGTARIFLEVAANNAPAMALYTKWGAAEIGRRRNYYRGSDGMKIDAIVMQRQLIA